MSTAAFCLGVVAVSFTVVNATALVAVVTYVSKATRK